MDIFQIFGTYQLAFLGVLVFFAGFVDSLAGGGGLITLPAYLSFGLDPALLLGTNKLSSSMGTFVAAWKYIRELRIGLFPLLPVFCTALIGSYAGAGMAMLVNPDFIRYLLIIIIPVAAWFTLRGSNFGFSDESHTLPGRHLNFRLHLATLVISCYDGFMGPGTGTFFAIALVSLCRYDMLQATAKAKLFNLASNISALTAFLIGGRVNIKLGIVMGIISMAGNYTGSKAGIRRGVDLIKPVVGVVSILLLVKVIWGMVH